MCLLDVLFPAEISSGNPLLVDDFPTNHNYCISWCHVGCMHLLRVQSQCFIVVETQFVCSKLLSILCYLPLLVSAIVPLMSSYYHVTSLELDESRQIKPPVPRFHRLFHSELPPCAAPWRLPGAKASGRRPWVWKAQE